MEKIPTAVDEVQFEYDHDTAAGMVLDGLLLPVRKY